MIATGLLGVSLAFAGTGVAAATYTRDFHGEGASSFGFAWDYARWDARRQAIADGFTDPSTQCTEIFAWGDVYWAQVTWRCTR